MKTELFQSVHNKAEYINFEYTLNWQTLYFGLFLSAIPYQAFTLARMCYIYCKSKSKATLHLVPFTSLMMMGYSNLFFCILDNIVFRLPSTAIFTSLCASSDPNKFLIILYILQLNSTYLSLGSSFLFCVTRCIIHFIPLSYKKIAAWTLLFGFVIIICFGIYASSFMFGGIGYCRQWDHPFSFGAVYISYAETDQRHDPFFVPVTITLSLFIVLVNIGVICQNKKMAKTTNAGRRVYTDSAGKSLYYTTLAMIIPYLFHGCLTVVSVYYPATSAYVILIRSAVTDVFQCSILALYNKHTMFQTKKTSPVAIIPLSNLS
ncbi:hypothetical protein GCK72_024378 [Caenorhabditis remanei]|uniref:Uncharacterized protein n=1 Tax=Caenorhabditis remanei TaxID=31234 RepID=A0A6A5FZN8_CAERE|nr:hypothetical protein GCK72_024378 [Caenorhabditis remanei]KAF1747912.1 hypothetical protein GCK72_024378 [Caenorhabditis remanei]